MILFPAFSRRCPAPRRRTPLNLQALEDRATPATPVYSPLTQTLTITAAQGDRIEVAPIVGEPTGYILVTETQAPATVFNSDTNNRPVRNLIVRFNAVNSGALTLNSNLQMGGNLSVFGAKLTQELDLLGTVGGNLNYTAAPGTAVDDLDIEAGAKVGGNMTLALGAGDNIARLKGGTIRGNLTVTGAAGIDRVELTAAADLDVGGSAAFNLGDGNNAVVGINLHLIRIGSNFAFTATGGSDTFDLDGSGSTLQVGQDARFTLGNLTAFDANVATFESIIAGRNIQFTGGAGADSVTVSGGLLAGGSVISALGEGSNSFDSNLLGGGTNSIGIGFTYTGGAGGDAVSLDAAVIGRNVTVTLGESGGASQAFNVGTKSPNGVTVFGNLKVTGGSADDAIALRRLYVGNILTVSTVGGIDTVALDDVDVAGLTTIDLGTGADSLLLEMTGIDSAGSLNRPTTFGGTVTIRAGEGNDTVSLSDEPVPILANYVHFGAKLVLLGGTGSDTLGNAADNIFEVTGNSEDFETLNGPALP